MRLARSGLLLLWTTCAAHAASPRLPVVVSNGVGPLKHIVDAALSTEALRDNPAFGAIHQSDYETVFMRYLVQCALPEGQSITVQLADGPMVFQGSLGLAPSWADAPCDEACQEWVTACLLARTNLYGLPVRLYMTGPNEALRPSSAPSPDFPVNEGAFYGNVFADPPRTYVCRGTGSDSLYSTVRVCTQPGNRCGYTVVGPCGSVDGLTGEPSTRRACAGQAPDGAWLDCRNRPTLPDGDAFPEPSRTYSRVVTVQLRRTTFDPGPDACGASPPPVPPQGPPPDAPALPGDRCLSDDDCASDLLVCDASTPASRCSAPCQPGSDAQEQAACGGAGTTCLIGAPGTEAICTRTCDPGAPDACPPGRVCTGLWIDRSDGPDEMGCYPFCSHDADCPIGPCDTRNGACGQTFDPAARADGQPCDGQAGTACRGACFRIGGGATEGICGSYVDRAVTTVCPDTPDRVRAIFHPSGDNLGLCLFLDCRADADCPAPLRCLQGPTGAPVCTYGG